MTKDRELLEAFANDYWNKIVKDGMFRIFPEDIDSFLSTLPEEKEEKWIPVGKEFPRKGQNVLVIQNPNTTATREPLFAIYDGKDFIPPQPTIFADYEIGKSKWVDIIFWMPLPEFDSNNQ